MIITLQGVMCDNQPNCMSNLQLSPRDMHDVPKALSLRGWWTRDGLDSDHPIHLCPACANDKTLNAVIERHKSLNNQESAAG